MIANSFLKIYPLPAQDMRSAALLLVVIASVSSCSTPSPFGMLKEKELEDLKLGVIGMSAEVRVVIANEKGKFVAEPPPDVAADLTSSFEFLSELDANVGDDTAKLRAEVAKELAKTSQILATKSQGVLFARDMAFRLNEAYVNDLVSAKEWKVQYSAILSAAKEILEKEIDAAGPAGITGATLQSITSVP